MADRGVLSEEFVVVVGLAVLAAARSASATSDGAGDEALVEVEAGTAEAILTDGPRTSAEARSKDDILGSCNGSSQKRVVAVC